MAIGAAVPLLITVLILYLLASTNAAAKRIEKKLEGQVAGFPESPSTR